MAPARVLLDSHVELDFDEELDDGPAAAAVEAIAYKTSNPLQLQRWRTIALLDSLIPYAQLVAPPAISTFKLQGSISHRLSREVGSKCLVACTADNLIVLYGGDYDGPGSPATASGCYIVLDAAAASPRPLLSTVPPPPNGGHCFYNIGNTSVALRRQPPSSASYLLAELAGMQGRGLPHAVLNVWLSNASGLPWMTKAVRLPYEALPRAAPPHRHNLTIDTSFSVPGSPGTLCWVDLDHGIIVCGNPEADEPVFRFVPFPHDCPEVGMPYCDELRPYGFRPCMNEFRTAACVGGAVRLVAVLGPLEGWSPDKFELATWTLSPDFRMWQRDSAFRINDLRATQEYRALHLDVTMVPEEQENVPIYPVLSLERSCSPEEEEEEAAAAVVVYAVFNKIGVRTTSPTRCYRAPQTEYEFKCQYVLGIDVCRNKIISTASCDPRKLIMLGLHATEFSCGASLHCKDDRRQREVEAASDAENQKRLKVV